MIPALRFESLMRAVFMSVAMYPGEIALTLIPLDTHSFDRALVS